MDQHNLTDYVRGGEFLLFHNNIWLIIYEIRKLNK